MRVKLGDILTINPRESIPRGTVARKIAMENLRPFQRDVFECSYEKYKGGTKFRNRDTILARITPCLENGKTAFINCLNENELAFGSTEYYVLRPKEKILDPYYLFYLVTSKKFRSVAIKGMTGTSGRQRVPKEIVKSYELDLPSIEVQRRISSILRILDDKQTINNKINDNLFALASTTFEKDFPNITDQVNPVSNYLLPKRGKNILKRNVLPGDVPVVAGGLEPAAYHNESNTANPVITISSSGANAGYIRLWNENVWSSDSSFIDSNITSNIYFWYIFLKKRQKDIFDMQTGSAQPHIYPKHIGNLLIGNIDPNLIGKFNSRVTPIFNFIGKNTRENKILTGVKNNLLSIFVK